MRLRTYACGVVALAASLLLAGTAQAQLRTVARFSPAKGLISDAALLGNGNIVLAYPDEGYLADYAPDGKLTRHIMREAGMHAPFRPTVAIASDTEGLWVFDEVERKIMRIAQDGQYGTSIVLSVAGEAPAQVYSLSRMEDRSVWVHLPGDDLIHFSFEGKHLGFLDLATALPYPGATFTRAQVLPDGSVYVLDYHQGAILYRRGKTGEFRRLRVSDSQFEAQPAIQDFAVDSTGNVLAATHDDRRPVVLLQPEASGHRSRPVSLNLGGPQRIAVRYSRGKFILWTRDDPQLYVLQLP